MRAPGRARRGTARVCRPALENPSRSEHVAPVIASVQPRSRRGSGSPVRRVAPRFGKLMPRAPPTNPCTLQGGQRAAWSTVSEVDSSVWTAMPGSVRSRRRRTRRTSRSRTRRTPSTRRARPWSAAAWISRWGPARTSLATEVGVGGQSIHRTARHAWSPTSPCHRDQSIRGRPASPAGRPLDSTGDRRVTAPKRPTWATRARGPNDQRGRRPPVGHTSSFDGWCAHVGSLNPASPRSETPERRGSRGPARRAGPSRSRRSARRSGCRARTRT